MAVVAVGSATTSTKSHTDWFNVVSSCGYQLIAKWQELEFLPFFA
jgi:hypothetical protein